MDTIKERASVAAWLFRRATSDLTGSRADDFYTGFIAGANSEHDELLRWHDQKEKLPPCHKDVEIKTDKGKIRIVNLELTDNWGRYWNISGSNHMVLDAHVVGWRPIPE